MRSSGKTTRKTEKLVSPPSRAVAIVETQPEESTPYSENLKQEISQQTSLTVGYATRLQHLIHSQVEQIENDYLEDREPTRKLTIETVETLRTLGNEFRETIKLGVQLAGLKAKIERGDSV